MSRTCSRIVSSSVIFLSMLCIASAQICASELFQITKDTHIICEADEGPLHTACEELRQFIRRTRNGLSLNVSRDRKQRDDAIVIGTGYDNDLIREWMKQGVLEIRDFPSDKDAFEIVVIDGTLVLAASNPGSAIDAVYKAEEVIKQFDGIPVDTHEVVIPYFKWRVLHPRSHVRGSFHEYRREDFAFIRRAGGNAALLTHDWMGEKYLHSFVPSETFPKAIDPQALERNRESLRRYASWADKYGLRVGLWICAMPCQGGPWMPESTRQAFLDRYPHDVLSDTGTYQGHGLCVANPLVRQDIRQMVKQLLTDYPQVSFIQLFTLDSNAEFCSPEKCERHQGVSKIEQRNDLIELILEAGRPLNPDLHVLTTSWGWQTYPDFLERQRQLPSGSGLFSTPDGEAWSFDRKLTDRLVAQREICRERGQLFFGYDIFFWGDDVHFPPMDRIYDYPFGIGAKMRRWARLQTDGVFDQWGTAPEMLQSNAFALREFFFDPFQPIEPVVERIAQRQFGGAAPHVIDAWREIEAAQQLQSDHTYFWHELRPNWAITTLGVPPTLENLSTMTEIPGSEPWKRAGPIEYVPSDEIERAQRLGIASRRIVEHLNKALIALERARCELAPTARSFYTDYLTELDPISPAEQLESQITSVKIVLACQREIGHFCEAYALVKQLAEADEAEKADLKKRHRDLMVETLEGSRQLLELLETLKASEGSRIGQWMKERMTAIESELRTSK